MEVVCSKCGLKAHSKCPWDRTVFPNTGKLEMFENAFFQCISFKQEPKAGFREDAHARVLIVEMITFGSDIDEEKAFIEFVKRFKRIPDEYLPIMACKHSWDHTEDCRICGHKVDK